MIELKQYESIIKKYAFKYSRGSDIFNDLMQVGYIGLLNAQKRYNQDKGPFISFLIPTITGEMKRYLRDNTFSLKVPRKNKELLSRVKKARESLENKTGKATIKGIAEILNIPEKDVFDTIQAGNNYFSLSYDIPGKDGENISLLDITGENENGYKSIENKLFIEKALSLLDQREKEVLKALYIDQKSQKQAGELLNISQMHISRINKNALQKIKNIA